jgi:uncharacterized protein
MSFLTAEWRKLVVFNYEVSPSLLAAYLPAQTELDLWEERCYVSLVGFMFHNTKVLGVKVPFHVNFEEVNLRFYVKRKVDNEWRRGAAFIKELVPKHAITLMANSIYGEHYQTVPMNHNWKINDKHLDIEYSWELDSVLQSISVSAQNQPTSMQEGSHEQFILEHYWGYTKLNEMQTNEYEVTHPSWMTYPVASFKSIVDFEKNYGSDFANLNHQQPASVLLAEGSEITVESKTRL